MFTCNNKTGIAKINTEKSYFKQQKNSKNGVNMNKNPSIVKTALIGLIVGLVNGVFGSGGGTILVPCLVFLMGIEDHKAHATAISIILPLSLISSFIYFSYDVIDLNLALKVAIGSVMGALVGSCLLNKVPVNALRKIFGIFMIIAAIRMVF
ncbi:MAG TPA: sulfite exporter TauE/SafE family protein [Clostridia bacterium]|nr:sulfite exporter TauE/SafE family protein [Clostridia bacterium]